MIHHPLDFSHNPEKLKKKQSIINEITVSNGYFDAN